jgi:DNA polymerase-3 subunit delta
VNFWRFFSFLLLFDVKFDIITLRLWKGGIFVAIIKEADFRKEIKSAPRTGYLFFGEEDYMKAFALKIASEAICPDPSFAFFNEIRLDSISYSPDALLDALMPLPMMAERKLVVVTGMDFGAMRPYEIDAFVEVLSQLEDYEYNTLIISVASDRIDAGKPPKSPSAIVKHLGEYLTPVYFEKNSPAKLASWVGKHFEHNGVIASPAVCSAVIDYCGRDMYNLASETDKLSFFVRSQGRDQVTPDDVRYISTPAAEYNAFALTNAIAARRKDEALDVLKDLKMRRVEPVVVMGEVSKAVHDMATILTLKAEGMTAGEVASILGMHEYRVSIIFQNNVRVDVCRALVARCRAADLELKRSYDGYAAIERLICTI